MVRQPLDFFDQNIEVECVRWRRDEAEVLIEPAGALSLAWTARAGCPRYRRPGASAALRVFSRPAPIPPALRSAADGQPGEQHDRHGMTSEALAQPTSSIAKATSPTASE